MLRDLFMTRRSSTSGRLSCLVWAQPSSAAAMCRSKRSDTDFFRSLGLPLKKDPSHCFITLSTFSVLSREDPFRMCKRRGMLQKGVILIPLNAKFLEKVLQQWPSFFFLCEYIWHGWHYIEEGCIHEYSVLKNKVNKRTDIAPKNISSVKSCF